MSSVAPRPYAVAPGIVPLRPLSLGEIYDGSLSAVRANPRTVLGIAALMAAVTALVDGLASMWTSDPALAATGDIALIPALVVPLAVGFFTTLIATGLLTSVVAAAVLGRELTSAQAWAYTRGRLVPLLGLTLLVALVVAVVLLVPVVFGGLIAIVYPPAGLVIGMLLLIPAGGLAVYLSVAWLLAPPVLILEGRGVTDSLARSRSLAARSWWRILGIALLGYFLVSFVAAILALPTSIVSSVLSVSASAAPWAVPLANAVGSLISGIVTLPFTAAMITLLYVDVRMRREGLDLDLAFSLPEPGQPVLGLYAQTGQGR